MASVATSALSQTQKYQLVCTYAALLLHDGELEISVSTATDTVDPIETII